MSSKLFSGNQEQMKKWVSGYIKNLEVPHLFLLSGDLGSGKTSFVRAFLHSYGNFDEVDSPSYSIINKYEVKDLNVYHIDLYRVANLFDLESTGFWDLFSENTFIFVEWPELIFGQVFPKNYLVTRLKFEIKDGDLDQRFISCV